MSTIVVITGLPGMGEVEHQIPRDAHGTHLSRRTDAEVNRPLRLIGFGDERGVDRNGPDIRTELPQRNRDAAILDCRRNLERGDLLHIGPDGNLDAVNPAAGDVEVEPCAIAAHQLHGPTESFTDRLGSNRGRENIGVGIPAVVDIGKAALRWLDLYGEAHEALRLGNGKTVGWTRLSQFEPPRGGALHRDPTGKHRVHVHALTGASARPGDASIVPAHLTRMERPCGRGYTSPLAWPPIADAARAPWRT
jgi:hypothetical protein